MLLVMLCSVYMNCWLELISIANSMVFLILEKIDLFHPCHEIPMSCLTFASSKGYMKVERAHHL
jgi:hypothetical protein